MKLKKKKKIRCYDLNQVSELWDRGLCFCAYKFSYKQCHVTVLQCHVTVLQHYSVTVLC